MKEKPLLITCRSCVVQIPSTDNARAGMTIYTE